MINKMSRSSMTTKSWYRSMLAGNDAFNPGSYDLISTAYGTGSSASITFDVSSLASTYKHLQIRAVTRFSLTSTTAYYLRFNGVSTGTAYADHRLLGNPSVPNVLSQNSTSNDRIEIKNSMATSGYASGEHQPAIIDILDFGSSSKNKTARYFSGGTSDGRVAFGSGLWASTAAITSINLSFYEGAFTTSSRFSLYGIKG